MPPPPMTTFELDEMPLDSNIFALLVGENGAGKTTALASMKNPGDERPICIIDIDQRVKGIKGSPWVETKGIKVVRLAGTDLLAELEGLFTSWEIIPKAKFPYQLIALDGFTGVAMLLTDNSFGLTSKMQGRSTQGHPKIGNVDLPGLDEFGYELAGFKNIMTFLKYDIATKCNVICTAHWVPRWGKDGKNQTIEIGKKIHLRNSILPNVLMWFDEVWYFEKTMASQAVVGTGAVKYEKHIVQFRNELARTTFANLPNEIDITKKQFYPLLLEAMRGKA